MTDEVTTGEDKSGPPRTNRVLDHSVLLSFVDGDEDLLRRICSLFLRSYPGLIFEMRDALARNDGGALARAAHTLKGSGGFFLTDSVRNMLTDLELIGHAGDLNGAPARLVELEAEMERLKPELSILAAEEMQSHEE